MILTSRNVESGQELGQVRPWSNQEPEGYVYFIERSDGYIKIGFSITPRKRLKQLRAAGGPMELACAIRGTVADERELHAKFAKDNIIGEWFKPSDELTAYVSKLKEVQ